MDNDTGATDHVTPFLHLLHEPQIYNSTLQLPNGDTAAFTYTGKVHLTPDIILTNVLCVPTFVYNLLSISKLVQGTDYKASFVDKKCYLQGSKWTKSLELGCEVHYLYILQANSVVANTTVNSSSMLSNGVSMIAHVANSNVWHARIGHASAKVLKLLYVKYQNDVPEVCDSCHFAKQSRLVFPESNSHSTNLFDLVHVDLGVPYRFKTRDNCSMFLTLVEDKSRMTWVYLLPDKIGVATLSRNLLLLSKLSLK